MNSLAKKNFLITGGTGFVGQNLRHFLLDAGANVVAIGSHHDLSNTVEARYLFSCFGHKFDYIIHGAALTAAGNWPATHRAEQFEANVRIHMNTLAMWHEYQPQAKFIGLGSSCAYPGDKEFMKESDFWSGPMHPSVETFGFTKKMLMMGIEAYKSQYGLSGTTVIPATLFGPFDHFDPEKSHVVSALIIKFVNAVEHNFPTVEVWGDGTQTREIMYVGDQIAGLCTVLDYNGPLINIGSGVSTSIRSLAETLKEVTGFKGEIFYDTSKFVGSTKKVLDIGLARSQYGWTTDIQIKDLKTRLQQTVEWYRKTRMIC